MKYYLKSLSMHFKTDMEYKKSFIMAFIAQIFVLFSNYFIIIALFSKFNNIKGFTLYEVMLCYGIIQFGFSIYETFFRGVDKFEDLIIDGSYDRLLVRPRSIMLQIICSKADLVKLSRLIQTIIILVISIVNLQLSLTLPRVLTLIFMLMGSVMIFSAIFLIAASYCFLTVQGLEIKNLICDGGKHMAQYPIGVFKKPVVFIFTVLIPYGCVNYYPLLYLLGKSNNILYMLSPFTVIIFCIFAVLLFRRGQKRYVSVGS